MSVLIDALRNCLNCKHEYSPMGFDPCYTCLNDLELLPNFEAKEEYILTTAEPSGELIRCGECVHCADDWNGNQPMFTCELARCGESVYPNDYCSRAERRTDE